MSGCPSALDIGTFVNRYFNKALCPLTQRKQHVMESSVSPELARKRLLHTIIERVYWLRIRHHYISSEFDSALSGDWLAACDVLVAKCFPQL